MSGVPETYFVDRTGGWSASGRAPSTRRGCARSSTTSCVSADPVASVGWLLAFAAGLLSFFSPCVVPIVPGYLSLVSGVAIGSTPSSRRQTERVVVASVLFVLGFTLVFVALGAAAGLLGGLLEGARPLSLEAGVLMIVMGLLVLGLVRVPFLARDHRVHFVDRAYGPFGVVLIGMAFGVGWTPCIGPILASILLYRHRGDGPGGRTAVARLLARPRHPIRRRGDRRAGPSTDSAGSASACRR